MEKRIEFEDESLKAEKAKLGSAKEEPTSTSATQDHIGLIDELRDAIRWAGYQPQLALLEYFASDASAAESSGFMPQTAVLCIPTQNTHGYEIIHRGAIDALAQTLVALVTRGKPDLQYIFCKLKLIKIARGMY